MPSLVRAALKYLSQVLDCSTSNSIKSESWPSSGERLFLIFKEAGMRDPAGRVEVGYLTVVTSMVLRTLNACLGDSEVPRPICSLLRIRVGLIIILTWATVSTTNNCFSSLERAPKRKLAKNLTKLGNQRQDSTTKMSIVENASKFDDILL